MFFYDPGYMLLMLVGMVLIFIPQQWVIGTFRKFNEIPTASGMTGEQVASAILRENGLSHVSIEAIGGSLSDHYDPGAKVIRLSTENYYGRSISNVAVAAHETGHAIQHAKGYFPVVIRSALVPAVNFGSGLGPWLIMISLGLGFTHHLMPQWAWMLAWVGVFLYGAAVAFHFVTLPVELDASSRALHILSTHTYLSSNEMTDAKKVLTAAAFTYVATALYALIQLIYFIMRLLGSNRREN